MGKSTLLNALLQEDLCICTSRPQTTRHAILGILSTNNTQICFIDTPGIIEAPAYKLQEGLMEAVTTAFREADVLLVVTDLFSTPIPNDTLFTKVQKSTKPVIVVINKIDLKAQAANVDKQASSSKIADDGDSAMDKKTSMKKTVSVEEAVALWRQLVPNALLIVPTSAQNGPEDPGVVFLRRLLCGGPNVRDALRNLGRPIHGMFQSSAININDPLWNDDTIRSYLLPLSPPLYDTDIFTDRTERFVASEIIRSVLFTTFQKELPYCCEVRITEFKEPKELSSNGKKMDHMIRVSADIVVERDSQKAIVIGTNGQQIKHVGVLAREKLQDFLQEPVCF
jgi:GTP-binding protein Era